MLGKQSIQFQNPPCIINSGSIVGSKEGQGPMGKLFDKVGYDDMFGAKTWEEAESALQREALQIMLEKENLKKEEIQLIFAGDLLGQSIASSFGLSSFHTPHIGLYGACSTCGLSISVCSMAVAGGFVDRAACVTSSHFASAEKEFRFPLSYGNQRPLSATWTVTGSAAFLVASDCTKKAKAKITGVTFGRIMDYGIRDSMNMGACMAPAAADSICRTSEELRETTTRLLQATWARWGSSFCSSFCQKTVSISPNSIWTAAWRFSTAPNRIPTRAVRAVAVRRLFCPPIF